MAGLGLVSSHFRMSGSHSEGPLRSLSSFSTPRSGSGFGRVRGASDINGGPAIGALLDKITELLCTCGVRNGWYRLGVVATGWLGMEIWIGSVVGLHSDRNGPEGCSTRVDRLAGSRQLQ